MDSLSTIISIVFRELARFGDGEHAFYFRTDAQTFLEVHPDGRRNVFTSPVAALMPNVVIKLQTPMYAQIVSAVPPQQGHPIIRDPHTRLNVADSLTDIIALVKEHQAAVLREDATLVSWSNDVQAALASLFLVHKEVNALLTKYDPVHAVDPTPIYGDGIFDSTTSMDCFDQFIHNYEPAALAGDKLLDSSLFDSMAYNSLPPLGTLDSINSIDNFFSSAIRPNYFETLSSAPTTQSPLLSDSPTNFMTSSISRLCLHSPPSHSATFSPSSMSFTFSSPSSSGSGSDSMLSTPMTIAPSVLSTPHSWNGTPLSDVASLPAILETPMDEHFEGVTAEEHFADFPQEKATENAALPELPAIEHIPESAVNSPGKRKRSASSLAKANVIQSDSQQSEKARPRSVSRSVSPKAPKSPTSRARQTASTLKESESMPTPPAPKRVLCPLPGRTVKSARSASPADFPSVPAQVVAKPTSNLKAATAARLADYRATTAACCDEDECEHDHELEPEIVESDADDESEYEADKSSEDGWDDDIYEDEEFRPTKRTRGASSCSPGPASSDSSRASSVAPVSRKAVGSKVATSKKGKGKKTKSTWSKSKKGKKSESDKPAKCRWCPKFFTREGDMKRHEERSCTMNPHRVAPDTCPRCFQSVSRRDALLRHLNSDRCRLQQRLKAEADKKLRAEAVADGDAEMEARQQQSVCDLGLVF